MEELWHGKDNLKRVPGYHASRIEIKTWYFKEEFVRVQRWLRKDFAIVSR